MSESPAGRLLEREDIGDVTVLRVRRPMLPADDETTALFRRAFAVVEDDGRARVVLNLDGVEYLASMAIGQLVTLMRKIRSAEGRLVLCKLSRTVEELLRVTRLADVFLTYADEQEALRSFR
jgi:anti-anti-sigma factor